ncbi:hypothetical protein L228DRAFT_271680 [Xylona heveae TC161]|uniref:Uncharacterized protein n=1 Tax=Xylona heveae (strain CBS 132557 / TC161) TaxID=1328760 RepID=A0A164ZG04_XYLHT|nr:hypothetical protein L228DRAFT_271680 [Xylona heveae TC161]KZF19056.1 hypothetical protein L228DRAFT_271680 [Xylona heveae TC161]
MTFKLIEPHPSVPKSNYVHSGRGGAGNIVHIDAKEATDPHSASGPASRIALSQPATGSVFASGRGGAGNMHQQTERALFSFDEELQRQQTISERAAPVYHIGRGGAGNTVDEMRPRASRSSTSSAVSNTSSKRRGSSGSRRSSSDGGVWARLGRTFSSG